MNKLLYIFILVLSSCLMIKAQPPRKFFCTYGGNGYDYGYDVKQTLDNGYIITGSTSSFGQGNTDAYLLKLDSMGQKKFEKSFGSYNNDIGKSVVQLADSSYVILGYTNSYGIGGYDIYLFKTDKNGNLLWEKNIGGNDWDFAYSLQATNDGGFIIGGTTYSYGYGNADGYVIKLDVNGTTQWSKTFGGRYNDEFKSVIQTQDGNYALTGYTKSYNDTVNGDAWLFRISSNGDSLYSERVGGIYEDVFNNVIQLPNSNLYFVGANKSHTNGNNFVNWQYVIDNSNNLILNNFIGNTNTERYNYSSSGLNGTIVSVGYNNYMGNVSDANIHLFTPSLGYIAYYPFGVAETDELFSVSPTKDKGFVATGTSKGNTTKLNDLLFVKIDSTGSYGASIIGIHENIYEISVNVFPNPSSDNVNYQIKTMLPLDNLYYKIIDISGNELFMEEIYLSKGLVNIKTLSSGLYFFQIYSKNVLLSNSKISVIK